MEHERAGPAIPLPPPTLGASYTHAWEMFKRFWPQLLLVMVLLFLIVLGGTVVQLAWERNERASQVGSAIGTLYSLLVVGPFEIGALYAFLRAARGVKPHVDDLFAAFRTNYFSAVFTPVLTSAAILLGLLAFVIPGLYVAVRLSFAYFLVVDEGLGPIAAIRRSWRLTEGRFWTIFGSGLVGLFVVWVGVILLIVGVIPAALWVGLAFATLYAAASRAVPDPSPTASSPT